MVFFVFWNGEKTGFIWTIAVLTSERATTTEKMRKKERVTIMPNRSFHSFGAACPPLLRRPLTTHIHVSKQKKCFFFFLSSLSFFVNYVSPESLAHPTRSFDCWEIRRRRRQRKRIVVKSVCIKLCVQMSDKNLQRCHSENPKPRFVCSAIEQMIAVDQATTTHIRSILSRVVSLWSFAARKTYENKMEIKLTEFMISHHGRLSRNMQRNNWNENDGERSNERRQKKKNTFTLFGSSN